MCGVISDVCIKERESEEWSLGFVQRERDSDLMADAIWFVLDSLPKKEKSVWERMIDY